jgi:hypothetical protein
MPGAFAPGLLEDIVMLTNNERLQFARERLTECQLAVRGLLDALNEGIDAAGPALWLSDTFESLEAVLGAPITPAALFEGDS